MTKRDKTKSTHREENHCAATPSISKTGATLPTQPTIAPSIPTTGATLPTQHSTHTINEICGTPLTQPSTLNYSEAIPTSLTQAEDRRKETAKENSSSTSLAPISSLTFPTNSSTHAPQKAQALQRDDTDMFSKFKYDNTHAFLKASTEHTSTQEHKNQRPFLLPSPASSPSLTKNIYHPTLSSFPALERNGEKNLAGKEQALATQHVTNTAAAPQQKQLSKASGKSSDTKPYEMHQEQRIGTIPQAGTLNPTNTAKQVNVSEKSKQHKDQEENSRKRTKETDKDSALLSPLSTSPSHNHPVQIKKHQR